MKTDRKLVKLIQKRVANIAIGASALRGQGPVGTIKKAREFMAILNLRMFKDVTERKFKWRLDYCTKQLMRKLPRGARQNWGGARKAINIFLEAVFYDRFLVKIYKLHRLKDFLELPLDSNVIKGLKAEPDGNNLPRWNGIKNLNPRDSEQFQAIAKKVAHKRGISRIHLDLYYWRA